MKRCVCMGVAALFLTACSLRITINSDSDAVQTTDAVGDEPLSTRLLLPEEVQCQFAGFGATLAFEGKRLNYTCGENLGLIGEITLQQDEMTLELATLQGTNLVSSEVKTLPMLEIELEDGTLCRNAGRGATLAFEGKRLNFTCGDSAGLIGEMKEVESVFHAEWAQLEGTSLVSSREVNIRAITLGS